MPNATGSAPMPAPMLYGSTASMLRGPIPNGAWSDRLQQNVFSYFDGLLARAGMRMPAAAIDMDWKRHAQQVLNSKKCTLFEANTLPEFAVNHAAGTEAVAKPEMANILRELPDNIQETLGLYHEGHRMVILNSYLNTHLFALPEHDWQAVVNAGGDNHDKFVALKEKLMAHAATLEDI